MKYVIYGLAGIGALTLSLSLAVCMAAWWPNFKVEWENIKAWFLRG